MTVLRTLSILKPDATRRNLTGKINAKIEEAGLKIIAQKMLSLTLDQARAFYAVHAERSFYQDLCASMCSEPVVVQVLEGEDAVHRYRTVMGATNPSNADEGTIRREFAESIAQSYSDEGNDFIVSEGYDCRFFQGPANLRIPPGMDWPSSTRCPIPQK